MTKQITMAAKHNWFLPAATIIGILSTAGAASASQISFSNTIPATPTDGPDVPFTLQKFDPTLGTLTSVDLFLSSTVTGTAGYENTNSSVTGRPITLNLSSDVSLTESGTGTSLGEVIPLATQVVPRGVPAFDGVRDFGGTSGATFTGLTDTKSTTTSFTAPAIPGFFIAPSSTASFFGLNFTALGNSGATGAGNIATNFTTLAGGTARVTYNYTSTAVPEPSNVVGIGMLAGLGALAAVKRKKQQA